MDMRNYTTRVCVHVYRQRDNVVAVEYGPQLQKESDSSSIRVYIGDEI